MLLSTFLMVSATASLNVSFAEDASFTVSIDGVVWLESAPIRAFAADAWQTLHRTGVAHLDGTDELGAYSCVNVSWCWDCSSSLPGVLHTSLKTYTVLVIPSPLILLYGPVASSISRPIRLPCRAKASPSLRSSCPTAQITPMPPTPRCRGGFGSWTPATIRLRSPSLRSRAPGWR